MRVNRYARFAWATLAYNLAVIVWGAYVRASGSGAGCGSHWPLCNGEIVPQAPRIQTLVEFAHRISSGGSLLLAVAMLAWAWRAYPRGHQVRLGAGLAMFFMITEALVGAGLVLLGLTDKDDSVARAVSLGIHLVNTFLLIGSIALTAWWASGGRALRLRGQGTLALVLGLALGGAVVVGVTGAITALGDTLFPAQSLAQGVRQDFSPTAHFLIQLRIIHPILAVLVGLFTIYTGLFAAARRPGRTTRWFVRALIAIFLSQLGIGLVNVVLLAPIYMQLLHLLMADVVWLTLVLAAAATLAEPANAAERATLAEPALRASNT
ncbi:MAG TPA: COX15/CtaA family protein [Kouleothrix sp.]|uniref:COX15/CtaA family protein n=1 Tax=Kouleothrix sp. TaxID=2779161 RepID=UPI002BC3F6C2|nr:COX15/CtaA family protein [Kouleothrix sp.]HRC75207.1 COX15/CtaA family protein [Kouleothrix sp.]